MNPMVQHILRRFAIVKAVGHLNAFLVQHDVCISIFSAFLLLMSRALSYNLPNASALPKLN